MGDVPTDWDSVLDMFEDRIDAQRAALELGAVDAIEPFLAPAVTGPVPARLTERAVALVHACRTLEDEIAAALEAARDELDRLADQPATSEGDREPVYFDSRV